jgi:multiple sugar transport system permease protein
MKAMTTAQRIGWWPAATLAGVFAVLPFADTIAAGDGAAPQVVRVVGRVLQPQYRLPAKIRELFDAHPEFSVQSWTGIQVGGAGSSASLAMGMAANNGPDLFSGEVRHAVSQGLAYPLTEWIGQDGVLRDGSPKRRPDGSPELNGRIDADEAKWDGWMQLPAPVRQAVTIDGRPWGLPQGKGTFVGILYSRSRLLKAGLDPMHPPRSWEAFIRWCRILYNHESGSPAVAMPSYSFVAWPFMATTGESVIVQERTSPTTGTVYTFNEQEQDLTAPDTGEDLSGAPVRWRTHVAGEGSMALARLYRRLRWAPWIVDPDTGEPVELSEADRERGAVDVSSRRIDFDPADVIVGSVFAANDWNAVGRLGRDVALYPLWGSDLTTFRDRVSPADLGMMPFPGMTPEHRPTLQNSIEYVVMGKDVARRGGDDEEARSRYRDFVWEMMWQICGNEARDEQLRRQVAAGQARFLNPHDLRRLGFEDYVRECPPDYQRLWERIDGDEIELVLEPFMGRWYLFRGFWEREVLDLILRSTGKDFDYETALRNLQRDAESGLMFDKPKAEIDRHRPLARTIAAALSVLVAGCLGLLARNMMRKRPSHAGVYGGTLPWLLLTPAVLLIGMWSYYPLLRGTLMAFQNYQVGGAAPFVGLDNFISVFLDPNFYHYVVTTLEFVLWSMVLSFVTPIILAFMLTETPWAKMFLRTLFFLPQVTSGLVVTLMWKEMYDGTAHGTVNRVCSALFGWLGFEPVDWLGNPSTVMICVILPGVWAGAGITSMIYQAALKSVPEDLYDASGIDGCGFFMKIQHIAFPTILPLVLINFVGAFIATFQGMASIFLLTFGGPGKETMVMGMVIWQEAYVNLRFSIATSYACILGTTLIALTYLQMRILNRVDFRRAED